MAVGADPGDVSTGTIWAGLLVSSSLNNIDEVNAEFEEMADGILNSMRHILEAMTIASRAESGMTERDDTESLWN